MRVPPGAYADYGFLLFRRGDRKGAIAYFEKERLLFPESSAFMTKLENAKKSPAIKPQPKAVTSVGLEARSLTVPNARGEEPGYSFTARFILYSRGVASRR